MAGGGRAVRELRPAVTRCQPVPKADSVIIRSKRTIAMPLPGVKVARSARYTGQWQSRRLRSQGRMRQLYGVTYATSVKEKGLHRCNPLNMWRARQDSNPRPLGS
jgi:hypothetical protein